jgi:cytochrome c biogenesis factor
VILVGELALWVALLMAPWGAIVSFAGGRSARAELVASGERSLYATFACLVLATAGLLTALVTSNFSLKYVAGVTSANLPSAHKITALWAGEAGGILSWALMLATCAAFLVAANQRRDPTIMPYVAGTLSIALVLLLAILCFDVNPYERVTPVPVEGRGMHPDLQHTAMAVHPPALYLGYATAAVPFAFAIAALIARHLDGETVLSVRRWATVSWFFMTLGIVSGMWWTYVDGSAGKDWWRDPIERGSLFPWLAATIFLSVVRRRSVALANRAKAPRYTLYVGSAAFLIASTGFMFRAERDVMLAPGDVATIVDPYRRAWTFVSQGLSDYLEHNRAVEAVALRLTRGGKPAGLIVGERRQYVDSRGVSTFEPSIEPGIDHSLLQDTYVVLTNLTGDRATLRIAFYPLMSWLWIGGILIAIGGAMVLWPHYVASEGRV